MNRMKKLLEANAAYGRRRVSRVFRDFCEIAALTIRNAVDRVGWDEREKRYREIVEDYTREEIDRFAETFKELVLALEAGMGDALGDLYMNLDLGNDRLGQFFTPYDVSLLSAKLTVNDLVKQLSQSEFITVHEPASGSGGMIIALAQALHDEGVDYQRSIHVTAHDLDLTAVHMTYVQLSLLFIPARIVHGNTLTLEHHDVWPTPAHVLGGWERRLAVTPA